MEEKLKKLSIHWSRMNGRIKSKADTDHGHFVNRGFVVEQQASAVQMVTLWTHVEWGQAILRLAGDESTSLQ